jgi:hypothetical protein
MQQRFRGTVNDRIGIEPQDRRIPDSEKSGYYTKLMGFHRTDPGMRTIV